MTNAGFTVVAALAILLLPPSVTAGDLEGGFAKPPPSARPWVYWFWMDGNISQDGITADLESMARVGIGGLILMEVDVGVPRGRVKFMSEPWRAMFGHAVREAKRLGLEITLNAGPGWTGSGGPWVRTEQSMQHLVASEAGVTGPGPVDLQLPQPQPRAPHFVHAPLPASVKPAWEAFYRDVAVLAFPTPDGGERIAEVDEKALYYRLPFSSHPGVKAYLPPPAVDEGGASAGTAIDPRRVIELTDRLEGEGRLRWDVPAGRWTILRLGLTSTGANTRPAPEAGIGLESDKFDRTALDAHFAAFVDPLLRAVGGRPGSAGAGWTMLHIDSWEMGAQNGSAGFREAFRRRRGYDPLQYLPAMTGRVVGGLGRSERFLWDVRQTAQELVIAEHAEHLKRLGRRHGLGLSIEPYDMNPCADLSLGGVAEVPMCEFWAAGYGFETAFTCFEAVSIAHTRGRRVVAAEAFTADHREAWRLHPGAMKGQADWVLAMGINRLVFHRFAHQPWLDRWPGMTMGPYGVHYDRTQTWWELAGAWHEYLARCQFLLRQGLPVADICYLAAEGAPHVFRPPASALAGNRAMPDRRGYNFDGCAPETVLDLMKVRGGRWVLPDGMSYRVLVLPETDAMTPPLLRKLRRLVRDGGTMVGPRPRRSPSLSGYPACDEEVGRLADELWGPESGGTPAAGRAVGRGRVIASRSGSTPSDVSEPGALPPPLYGDYADVVDVLEAMGVPPDFEADRPLRWVHRQAGPVEWYFVAHPGGEPVETRCRFRVTGRRPELWDPVTGEARAIRGWREEGGRTVVPLQFGPQGSLFVVFRRGASPPGTLALPSGNQPQAAVEVGGPWDVRFQSGRGAPALGLRWEHLTPWNEHPEAGVKHFSGRATYRARFELPGQTGPASAGRWFLDLGRVEIMARVRVNGKEAGVVWTRPFRLDVSETVRAGLNVLEIEVANLWPNRLIGDASVAPERRVSWTTWNPYRGDTPLLDSGLLGPVRVLHAPAP